jgi:hypothetical protein
MSAMYGSADQQFYLLMLFQMQFVDVDQKSTRFIMSIHTCFFPEVTAQGLRGRF